MSWGVECQAAEGAGGGVAQVVGHEAVGGLVDADGQYYAAEDDDEGIWVRKKEIERA